MFKILKTENATVEELAQAAVKIENYLAETKAASQNIKAKLESAFINGEPKSRSNTLKGQLSDCNIKSDACNSALNQIRQKIADRLPGEATARIQELEAEFGSLKDEESQLYKEFFRACAKAISVREKIIGVSYETSYKTEGGIEESLPKLSVEAFSRMEPEDSVFFCEATAQARQKNEGFIPVKTRLSSVADEIEVLQKMVASFNSESDSQVEKIINRYR